ncbi:MAG TPA: fibronectin type III domain-containing protein [Candidatus Paceibacterota bacterium]|nr:fibronectin type III domain-containing protein [Candidatus Paceibacterota bacterium]
MTKKIIFALVLLILILGGIFLTFKTQPAALAQSGTFTAGVHAVHGYAWSSNFGWIKFDPAFGGVFASTTGASSAILTGYAWSNPQDGAAASNNIGWLSFNDYSGCGSQPTIDLSTGAVSGWARFYNAISQSGNDGNWSGCVHLSGPTYSSAVTTGASPSFTQGSYWWGGDFPTASSSVGWIHLCGSNYCVTIDAATTTPATAPGVPSNLHQTNAGVCDSFGGIVNLAWNAGSPAPNTANGGGYYVYQTDSTGNTTIKKTVSYSTTASIGGLAVNGTFYFKVTAINVGGGSVAESAPTSVVTTTSSKVCNSANTAIIFNAVPPTVPRGGTCKLVYTVSFPSGCTITSAGNQDSAFPFSFVSATGTTPSNPTSGTTTTSRIYKTIDYTLTCGSLSAKTTCAIAPAFNEF